MNMKSKKFATPRRMSNAPTNMSPKAVSKVTRSSGGATAGKRIGTKTFNAKRVMQPNPAQVSKPGQRALTRKPSLQPSKAKMMKGSTGKPRSYNSVSKSVKKTMGY